MKRYEIKKDSRDFGKACAWYNKKNLGAVEAANPRRMVGGKSWPAAYFVEKVERVHDEMREFATSYDVRTVVAGPFSCETIAREWAAMH